jgi:hypothetical protein
MATEADDDLAELNALTVALLAVQAEVHRLTLRADLMLLERQHAQPTSQNPQ